MYHSLSGVFPNHFKEFDPKFTVVFHNTLPYPVDFYSVDFEGRRVRHSYEVSAGHQRKEETTLNIPWVFKRSNDSKRLLAFLGDMHEFIFKGLTFNTTNPSTEYNVLISDHGKFKSTSIQ